MEADSEISREKQNWRFGWAPNDTPCLLSNVGELALPPKLINLLSEGCVSSLSPELLQVIIWALEVTPPLKVIHLYNVISLVLLHNSALRQGKSLSKAQGS